MEQLERTKLVDRIEEDLERMVSRGEYPRNGCLPSERLLARQYGVARSTVREALLRLSARGLVVRRQGRNARAVALEHALTLESMGVALQAEGLARPGRRHLLTGYLELKRETTAGLLVRCCEHASEKDLQPLTTACFELWDVAHRDDGTRRWVQEEFELLRLAAFAAKRPGHFLLIQSLERAFWGMAGLVRPHLASEAVGEWALQTMHWLDERNVEVMRTALPPLLRACDEHVIRSLGPASGGDGSAKS